jgi:uncharacterized protein YraI
MKTFKSVDVKSFALYGALLAALKTFAFLSVILSITLLSACQPAPAPAPTQPPVDNQATVDASVAATIAAQPPAPTQPPQPTQPPPSTPAPTTEPTPALEAGDPALELGAPDGVDTFDSPINFGSIVSKCFLTEVTGGQFVMAANGLPGVYCWTTSWPQIQDFYIETTAIMPEVCTPGDQFGLLFRSPDSSSGYLFGLNCAGEYSLKRMTAGSSTDLVSPASSEYILPNGGEINRLGVVAYGGSFHLYANGKYLDSATDNTYVLPGALGYFINAATATPFVSRYEDLKVWTLDDAYYPSSAPPSTAPPVEPVPPESGVPSVIATTDVNVRSGPSTDYPVYGVAPTGASAPVTGISQDGGWYVITIPTTYSPDGTGWVSATYVTLQGATPADLPVVQPPPPPEEVVPAPPETGSLVVQTTEPVNVRAGPGNEFPSYGKIPAGTPLQAVGISQDGTWVAVVAPVPSGIGWVSAAYLQPFDPSSLPQM